MFSRSTALVTLLVVLTLMLANAASASACGFHSQRSIQQSLLNWRYPNASWVSGAIWSGQRAGDLPMPDRKRLTATGSERKFRDSMAMAAVTRALYALGAAFEPTTGERARPGISVVLQETMLWTRYPADGPLEFHVNGPHEADLVIVTDEPVVHAIEAGQLTVAAAVEAGYVRLYGPTEHHSGFLAAYGILGAEPLPKVDRLPLFVRMLLRGRAVDGGSPGQITQ